MTWEWASRIGSIITWIFPSGNCVYNCVYKCWRKVSKLLGKRKRERISSWNLLASVFEVKIFAIEELRWMSKDALESDRDLKTEINCRLRKMELINESVKCHYHKIESIDKTLGNKVKSLVRIYEKISQELPTLSHPIDSENIDCHSVLKLCGRCKSIWNTIEVAVAKQIGVSAAELRKEFLKKGLDLTDYDI